MKPHENLRILPVIPRARSQRQRRAGEVVRRALSEILQRLPPPSLAPLHVSVHEVRMSPDLRIATLFISPLNEDHMDEALAELQRARPLLRHRLARAASLKFTPDLRFLPDLSQKRAQRLARLTHASS